MTLVVLLIAVTIAADDDYDDAARQLRNLARSFGCEQPVIERLATEHRPTRLMVTCRDLPPN